MTGTTLRVSGLPMGALDGTAVLVVDDDIDNLDLVADLVRDAGATVRTARNGRGVLNLLPRWKPDVLLLDISLPEMDGYTLLSAIRHLPALGQVPAIAVTGHVSEGDRQRAADAGFDLHMTKPFEPDALVDTVARLVASAS